MPVPEGRPVNDGSSMVNEDEFIVYVEEGCMSVRVHRAIGLLFPITYCCGYELPSRMSPQTFSIDAVPGNKVRLISKDYNRGE